LRKIPSTKRLKILEEEAYVYAKELAELYRKEKAEASELVETIESLRLTQDQTIIYARELNRAYKEEKKRAKELEEALKRIEETYEETLFALVAALDAREHEVQAHSQRVSAYTVRLAEKMGISGEAIADIRMGALLHDIGKIGISDSILLKPGKLTPEEWVEMKKHPLIGYRILEGIKFLEGAAKIVYAHQERFDGRGYPRGLKGEEIPLGARLFAVSDTLDAMTSDRPYRKAMTFDVARDEIIRCRGSQFDPEAVSLFLGIEKEEWLAIKDKINKKYGASDLVNYT